MLDFKTKKIEEFEKAKDILSKFTINMVYDSDIGPIDVKNLSDLEEALKGEYPKVPKFNLFPRIMQSFNISPYTFSNDNGDRKIQIGRDYLLLIIKEYTFWGSELRKIMNVINALKISLGSENELPKIKQINLTYSNDFEIVVDRFKMNDYFTTFVAGESDYWDINYNDFFLGIVPYEKDLENGQGKMILRLRGVGSKNDKYTFNLQNIFVINNVQIPFGDRLLRSYLDTAHRANITFFVDFLTAKYKEKIGLKVRELEEDD